MACALLVEYLMRVYTARRSGKPQLDLYSDHTHCWVAYIHVLRRILKQHFSSRLDGHQLQTNAAPSVHVEYLL